MSTYNRKEHLKELHIQRKACTRKKIDEAIQNLIKARKSINFNSVSQESGVTKATLYNNSDIRERIESLRYQQGQAKTPAQQKIDINENNKDAIIESLKRKIKKLDEENKQLKEQLKLNYGDIYEKI